MEQTKELQKEEEEKEAEQKNTQTQQGQPGAGLDDIGDNTNKRNNADNRHKRRTVEDIRFDILCGVDVPQAEREMEVKDLYEKMQHESLKSIFGNTVSMDEFFHHLEEFRYQLNKKFLGGREIDEEDRLDAWAKRIENDSYMASKVDANGDGKISRDEITAMNDRVKKYIDADNLKNDMMAFNAVKGNDIVLRKFLVQKYMKDNPRFKGAHIEKIEEKNDEIRFFIRFPDGAHREFVPRFDRGRNGILQYEDSSVEKMVLNIKELQNDMDMHQLQR